uniref:AAA+ ATPase domain-containing protein n=1 Tax=Araucaria cunninghamii TaxID=56994 RepID=A0A0D6QR57_ARACU
MEMWSNLWTLMATFCFVKTIAKDYLPPELYDYFIDLLPMVTRFFSRYMTVIIEENEGFKVSEVYRSVQIYLSTRSSSAATRLKLNKAKNAKEFTFTMDKNEQIEDEFEGIKVWWKFRNRELKQQMFIWWSASDEKRYFELKFHKRHKTKVFNAYLPHIMSEAKMLELKTRQRKIYTNKGDKESGYRSKAWTPMVFEHPATFDTLALDPEMKEDILQDLLKFSQREKYYKKVGRAWKRGYLLYGPPGTGKSSMIAAMANFLDYDIYDLELTEVKSNTELRKLLIATTNKSIIVIEDIDCSLDLSNRTKKKVKKEKTDENKEGPAGKGESENEESKVTLSGVLNFTDGLWSCCGSERIIIFTTNHIDRLDPALLRSGRMDKHIHLSFCTFPAFRVLARNYLSVDEHPLFSEIELLMKEAEITPADVGEELMRRSDDPNLALEKLMEALRRAKEKTAAAKNQTSPENGNEEPRLVNDEECKNANMEGSFGE